MLRNTRSDLTRVSRSGFTLVEMIVVLLILALLAAVVIPVVADRGDDADPVRVATDLGDIKTGMELFHFDVRPRFPADLDDLVNTISTTESDFEADLYSALAVNKWDGPYIDSSITDGGEI